MGSLGFGEVDGGVVEVVAGVLEDELEIGVGGRALDAGGDAGDERAGRDDGAFGDEGAGGDDGAGADAGVVENGGADADEDGVFKHAAVDGGVMADGAELADGDGVAVALAMEDGTVLDVGLRADADAVDVAAKDGVHPDAGPGAEGDVAEDLGGGVDVAGGIDGGEVRSEGAEHVWDCRASGEAGGKEAGGKG